MNQEPLPFTPDGVAECACGRYMLADRKPHWHDRCSDWCWAVSVGIVPDDSTVEGEQEHYEAMCSHGLNYWSDKIAVEREKRTALCS